MEFSSKLIQNAVNEISQLPGIGKRTALRLVLHLLRQPNSQTEELAKSANPKRDNSILCIVEDIRDVMAIESTSSFKGLYHVLGGKISPMDGIGPDDLNIDSLVEKVKSGEVKELIFALSSTMEGDTTNFYIYKLIGQFNVVTSTIARGVSVGDDLEYADEITLGRSIINRIPFENSIKN